MAISILQIPLKTEPDILHAHELALQIARWAGLPVREQVCFAAAVVENCPLPGSCINQLLFSLVEKDNGHLLLRAELLFSHKIAEKELPGTIRLRHLHPFMETGNKRWEKAYADMQQFTFSLAHDLKNSMTKIKLALSLMQEESLQPPADAYMSIIHRAAGRFEEIMTGLSKVIELGDLCPDVVKKTRPELVFTKVRDEFAEILVKNQATITTDFTCVAELNYIEVYLESIFSNLLSNAIKYASPQRPLQFSVTTEKKEGKPVFLFSDNGQGIDLAVHGSKMFSPFTRFSTGTEGSGIGLYLVKNIVERNGGKIEVESTPGTGTSFRLLLQEYPLFPDIIA